MIVNKLFVTEKLSSNLFLTDEGYLLCKDSVLGRTGEMIYQKGQIDVETSKTEIKVSRTGDELFKPETLASLNLKSFTLDHPEDEVSVENWRELTVGIVQNPRQNGELLVADLLVTDKKVIELIQNRELRELSLGYDCDYTVIEDGIAIQSNIKFNHVSLVKNARGGSVCTIRDSADFKSKSRVLDLYLKLKKNQI